MVYDSHGRWQRFSICSGRLCEYIEKIEVDRKGLPKAHIKFRGRDSKVQAKTQNHTRIAQKITLQSYGASYGRGQEITVRDQIAK